MSEVGYDAAGEVAPTAAEADALPTMGMATPVDGVGCHAGAGQMEAAARMAGKSDILDQYAKDYPQGPHDKPQSMCPAFGSLRVGLRMRRVATVLSGAACCVYGLTFVSHFYGARRSVGCGADGGGCGTGGRWGCGKAGGAATDPGVMGMTGRSGAFHTPRGIFVQSRKGKCSDGFSWGRQSRRMKSCADRLISAA